MDLSNYSPKDSAIIRNNPDMSPYDLLHKKGLSNSAYRRMIEDLSAEKDEEKSKKSGQEEQRGQEEQPEHRQEQGERKEEEGPIKPHSVEPYQDKIEPHQPKLSEPNVPTGASKKVYNKATGLIQEMAANLADDLVNQYPNEFEIVDGNGGRNEERGNPEPRRR